MPITKLSHSKICFSRLNQRRITVAAKKKYGESGPARGRGVLLKLLFNPSDFGLVKKLLPSKEIAAGPAIRIYVFFICNIPFRVLLMENVSWAARPALASDIKKATVDLVRFLL